MVMKTYEKNYRPFTAICGCDFGRQMILTDQEHIDASNIVEELNKALSIHTQNKCEIEYLDRYYRGDQPIIYRRKKNRPEINNRVVINLAKFVVDTLTAESVSEPIQYVLREVDESKTDEIKQLNTYLLSEAKDYHDTELVRNQHIYGTAYRFIGRNDEFVEGEDDSPFYITDENPADAFVCYFSNSKKPAFSCQARNDVNGNQVYNVYTRSEYFLISGGSIIASDVNGNGRIPLIEYPRNSRRLSDIEVTIMMTDEINKMASDRSNAIEGFVSSWIKFINCEIDIEKFREVREEGFFSVTSNNGAENKSDVDIMSNELNQTDAQVADDDLFDKLLMIHGIANREINTGGDTGSAVYQRNGGAEGERRAELDEPIFKRSEREMLRIILNMLRVKEGFNLMATDIEIKITRSKLDNALNKAEVLQILLNCGIAPARAIKTVELFSDPEQVASESKKWLEIKYPDNTNVGQTESQPPTAETPSADTTEVGINGKEGSEL